MKILVFPTWFMVCMIFPLLPETHPWKKGGQEPFTLGEWAKSSTPITKFIALAFWASIIKILIVYFSFL